MWEWGGGGGVENNACMYGRGEKGGRGGCEGGGRGGGGRGGGGGRKKGRGREEEGEGGILSLANQAIVHNSFHAVVGNGDGLQRW